MSKALSVFTAANGKKCLGIELAVLLMCLTNVIPALSADGTAATTPSAGDSSTTPAATPSPSATASPITPPAASATSTPPSPSMPTLPSPSTSDSSAPAAPIPRDMIERAARAASDNDPGKKLSVSQMPAPKGQDAAIKLYTAKKFALAKPQFEKFVIDGTANIDSYAYLAYCLYNLKQYTKAMNVFDFVAKNATHQLTLQRSAENSARTLRCCLAGICPQNCLKANDPRWGRLEGKPADEMWIKFPDSDGHGYQAWSTHHIGELIVYEGGHAVNKGTCPTCKGTSVVPRLKDGAPLPH